MSALVTIKGRLRKDEEKGKNFCRRLRMQGEIPANLLEKSKSTPLVLEAKQLSQAWKGGKVFQLDMGGSLRSVSMKELQIDPIKRSAIHLDLVYV